MARTSQAAVALIAALGLVSACGNTTKDEGAPSTFATPQASAHPGTGSTGTGTGTAAAPVTEGDGAPPASAGHGKCLDLTGPTVRNAVAKLPAFRGIGYTAMRGTDAKAGDCPDLLWARAELNGGTGSSPEWVLFFDRHGYLGTATDRYTSFTSIIGSTRDSVAVAYRWLNPGDATAGPTGGPVVVTYTLSGRTVTPDKDVPREVFDGGAPTTTAAPTSPAQDTTSAAPTGTTSATAPTATTSTGAAHT